jgi:hypothetical protein
MSAPFRTTLLFLLLLAACVRLVTWAPQVQAWTPTFSYMTLNGLQAVAISVEDIHPDLKIYGLNAERLLALVKPRLETGGLAVIPYDEALHAPAAALLRVRIITNQDGHGFYHLSVKLELREKILLGNAAGGFVSQAVWTAAENGVMAASEVEKVDALVSMLTDAFVQEYRAQNSAAG